MKISKISTGRFRLGKTEEYQIPHEEKHCLLRARSSSQWTTGKTYNLA